VLKAYFLEVKNAIQWSYWFICTRKYGHNIYFWKFRKNLAMYKWRYEQNLFFGHILRIFRVRFPHDSQRSHKIRITIGRGGRFTNCTPLYYQPQNLYSLPVQEEVLLSLWGGGSGNTTAPSSPIYSILNSKMLSFNCASFVLICGIDLKILPFFFSLMIWPFYCWGAGVTLHLP